MGKLFGMLLQQMTECFAWLDALRESGRVNMFGSPPLLQAEFGLDKRQAAVFGAWARTFEPGLSPETRAATALSFDQVEAT